MAAQWSEEDTLAFIQIAVDEMRILGDGTAGFGKSSWTRIANNFKARTSHALTKQQLQSKLQTMKKKYTVFHKMKGNNHSPTRTMSTGVRREVFSPETPQETKKRRTSGDRISAALEKLAESHGKRTDAKKDTRTQLQVAISDFMTSIGSSMNTETQLRHIAYFTQNPATAEVFNILDDSMKQPFIESLGLI